MKQQSVSKQVANAVDGGWASGTTFIGSILSGLLIGYLLDRWLGTDPWFVVAFLLIGSYSGFMAMWKQANLEGEIQEEARRRARD